MANRLANETSPYLQQHADNPVDWHPWGEAALAEAKRTGKPILLSVGYSACHWCHVMAHESFEDPAIAAVMNENFVNIKVDREERPDIDQIYQLAQAMLTGRNGGWPLTMFLSPDQQPFYGGTYFPNVSRYGMPAFPDLLKRVRAFYDEHPDDVRTQGDELSAALARTSPSADSAGEPLSAEPLEHAFEYLDGAFDARHGGFGGAPKFPHPDSIELLLRRYAAKGDARALEMATTTLRRMAQGGIYDQVGGGFARYSVDERWAIPHFEKMLYDNGWLLGLYADAWAITRAIRSSRACARRPAHGSCARCSRPKAATTRRSTRTPKARKASITSGAWTRLARSSIPPSSRSHRAPSVSTAHPTSRATRGIRWSRSRSMRATRLRAGRSTPPEPSSSRPARSACAPAATRRCSRRGTP
ncbi:MAG TPA: DUF255 domain-containing protein [Usitatibacter sp.]|nr:DUF255 domain-containing protein [Usitatibacter sp.]